MDKYLITGANGYIGGMLTKDLLKKKQNVTVIIRDFNKMDRNLLSEVQTISADVTDREAILRIKGKYDYIIHCAAPTKSIYMIRNPVEVTNTIVNGTQNILALARQCNVKSMVYLSSMEVYGQIDCSDGRRVKEYESGYLDITNIRNCYPIAKLMAENICHSFYKEYGVPVKIARLAQTFGRGICSGDNRVFVQFANSVKNNTNIILHTKGNSMGNYCDIDDAVEAILFILLNGKNSECYNVVNEANTMSIREVAEFVAEKIAGESIEVVYDIPKDNKYGYAADTGLRLSGQKLERLGWKAKNSLEIMFRKMLQDTI